MATGNKSEKIAESESAQAAVIEEAGRKAASRVEERRLKGRNYEDELPSFSAESTRVTLGEYLSDKREKLGLSVPECARRLRCKICTVVAYERNEMLQPTSRSFARSALREYALVLGEDPEKILSMYERDVKDYMSRVNEQEEKEESNRNRRRSGLSVLALILFVGGSAGAWYFYSQSKYNSSTDGMTSTDPEAVYEGVVGEISLSGNNTSGEISFSAEGTSGEISLGSGSPAADESTAVISSSENRYEIMQNENAAKAEAQAKAIEQEIKSVAEIKERPQSLPVNIGVDAGEPDPKVAGTGQIADISAGQDENTETDEVPLMDPSVLSAGSDNKAAVSISKEENEAVAEKTAEKAEDPELSSYLKDISSSVQSGTRDGLASFNTAEIYFIKDAAVSVSGSSGKVLKAGVFRKGQKFSVTGIPPLSVSVTDTTAVRIFYAGAELKLPEAEQVRFKLPM